MTLVEDDARSTTMRHPHLYARTSWPCFKVTGLLATSHSPSAFVKRSPMWSCSGKMATDSADEGRLRFGHATGDPVSLILARPDVHRVIVGGAKSKCREGKCRQYQAKSAVATVIHVASVVRFNPR